MLVAAALLVFLVLLYQYESFAAPVAILAMDIFAATAVFSGLWWTGTEQLPLALGIGQGAAMLQPLAIAIIAGLVLTLPAVFLLLPVLFSLLCRVRYGPAPASG